MSDNVPLTCIKTTDREYITYEDRFLKKSFAPAEYFRKQNGDLYVPWRNKERLENEAACLRYIKERTDIPVPEVLDAYEENGSFFLWTERIRGVEMKELKEADRLKVLPQVLKYIEELKSLRSKQSGGPSGILCTQYTGIQYTDASDSKRNITWKSQSAENDIFVFCHCDLSQANIMVDPITLKILAIIDWEYSGYYPSSHEIPFYKSPKPSGAQVKNFEDIVREIKKFWHDCIASGGESVC